MRLTLREQLAFSVVDLASPCTYLINVPSVHRLSMQVPGRIVMTALLECFSCLAEGYNKATKKHFGVKSNLYTHMMIRHFLLVIPVPAFHFCSIPEFCLPMFFP